MIANLPLFIQTIGYVGMFCIVFAESGLLFGIFLPGDSLLFTAGLLASQGWFDVRLLAAICAAGALLGDSTGYWLGAKFGPKVFSREDSRWFHKEYIERTKKFYEKYGARAVVLARFVPIVRTVAPLLAGVGRMRYATFFLYNTIGALLWGAGITYLGYTLGTAIPNSENYLTPITLAIVAISLLPILREYLKKK